ncbi:conserved hypothetical protein [Marinoscillum sp. 108]|nr:conserved hypothetical protein [Marinoscillum sp. 108]
MSNGLPNLKPPNHQPTDMVLYQEEKKYVDSLRKSLAEDNEISKEKIEELLNKFEDMMEMTSVSIKMIDRLMQNYDKLKQQNGAATVAVKNQ